ncbi:MAG TPA: DUF885 domain-containing protein [Myxococcales bacterium]|nr:DUF885 domain-containing protein [Myxococcales bacterium]
MFILMALTLAAAAAPTNVDARVRQLNALLHEQWEHNLKVNPEYASILGDKRYNDQLSNQSQKAIDAEIASDKSFLSRFTAIDPAGMPEQDALNRSLMISQLKIGLEGVKFKNWEMPVSQFGGIHINAPQLIALLPFDTVKDYDDYIARLRKLPRTFDQTVAQMRKGLAESLMPPRILLEQVVGQAAGIAGQKPEESPFYLVPDKKMPASFSAADKARLRAAMLSAVSKSVLPAYVKFTAFVKNDYAPHGRKEPGVWSLPDGDARYAYAVKQSTTTELTPDQIHQTGLAEVARDRAAMLEIAQKLGFKDLKSFETALAADPKQHGTSRQQIVDLYKKYIDQMQAKLPELFGRLPKASVEVMPIEEFREKNASGADYSPGTPDGKRPGHINVNTGDFEKRLLTDVETTAYHEGVPGHHMQLSIAQELPSLPPFRQHGYYTAYTEGWALYSERLGREAGFYQDPYSLYGHYTDDLLRAIRLVVDTGFHSKHWTRQQVVDYFHDNSGIDEPTVQSETDRYMAWPAQALGYKVGQLKILALRERAQKELGSKFDIKSFHDEVLSGGALPLDVLDARIASWTQAQKGTQ